MIVFYLISALETILIGYIIRKAFRLSKIKDVIFDPFILFSVCWFAVYVVVPVIQVAGGTYKYQESYSDWAIAISKVQLLVFYLATALCYGWALNIALNRRASMGKEPFVIIPLNRSARFLNFIFLGFILVVTYKFVSYIMSFDLATYYKNRIILRKGMGLTILTIYTSNILLLILFINRYVSMKYNSWLKNSIKNVIIAFLIVLFTITYIYMGNRLTALLLLLALFMAYLYLKPRISRRFVIRTGVFSLVLLVLFSLVGFLRIRVNRKGVYQQFFADFFEKIEDNIITSFAKFENLVWLNDHYERWHILYGKTFAAGFTNVVPRRIWPGKWFGGGPELKNFIAPGTYDLKGSRISSYTTGLPTEAFMNFSHLGFIIVPFFFAMVLILLKKMERSSGGNIIILSLYLYLIISVCFVTLYGEFLGIFSRTLFVVTPFVAMYFLSKIRFVWKN